MKIKFLLVLLLSLSVFASQAAGEEDALSGGEIIYGRSDAPIQIVEFTDFECYFCGQAQPALQKILAQYPNEVALVFKNFPLSMHRHARLAHDAAMCANEQDKYWDYRNLLFQNQRAFKRNHLIAYASETDLDMEQFTACLDQEKYGDQIDADLNEGYRSGVQGTPTFVINGKMISGAVPFETFQQIIEAELEK